MRLKIDPAAAGSGSIRGDHRLVLGVAPGHLDEIAVFRVDHLPAPGVLVGDTHPMTKTPRSMLYYAVVFDDAVAPFEVLLRVRSQSNQSVLVWALRWDEARELAARQHALIVAYLVFTVLVCAWAAVLWLERRETVVGLFITHQVAALLVAVTMLGVLRFYGSEWMPAHLMDRLSSLGVPLLTMTGLLFHAALLGDLGAGNLESRLMRAMVVPQVLSLALIILGQVMDGLRLAHSMIPVAMTLTTVVAWRISQSSSSEGEPPRFWRRAYLMAIYVALALLTMPQSTSRRHRR